MVRKVGSGGSVALIMGFSLTGCAAVPQSQPAPEPMSQTIAETLPQSAERVLEAVTVSEEDIWSRLRQADTHYYVLMRHAIAPGTGDPANFQLGDCATQRNLSAAGRAQAERTGDAFKAESIAVQAVLSSEWCRCLDTAELLDLGSVERFPALNSFFQDRAKGPERTALLRKFMTDNRNDPGVTVLVTHFVNIAAIADSNVSSGEMVVMEINAQNEPEVVGQIEQF